METKFIEATNGAAGGINHGKFMVARFTEEEWRQQSVVDEGRSLLSRCGWDRAFHILVFDLQTGEGGMFRHGGYAAYDLNQKHQVWVCPLFEPFLTWLYKQDISDLDKLPSHVALDAPSALYGYRRRRTG